VPASFAWATVVHRVFDFVALRGAVPITVTAVCAGLYVLAEWWTSTGARSRRRSVGWRSRSSRSPRRGGARFAARALARRRVVPDDDTPALATWLHEHTTAAARAAVDADVLGEARLLARVLGSTAAERSCRTATHARRRAPASDSARAGPESARGAALDHAGASVHEHARARGPGRSSSRGRVAAAGRRAPRGAPRRLAGPWPAGGRGSS
jgi:hypothetical protein